MNGSERSVRGHWKVRERSVKVQRKAEVRGNQAKAVSYRVRAETVCVVDLDSADCVLGLEVDDELEVRKENALYSTKAEENRATAVPLPRKQRKHKAKAVS